MGRDEIMDCAGVKRFLSCVWGLDGYWVEGMKVRGDVLHKSWEFASAPSRIP